MDKQQALMALAEIAQKEGPKAAMASVKRRRGQISRRDAMVAKNFIKSGDWKNMNCGGAVKKYNTGGRVKGYNTGDIVETPTGPQYQPVNYGDFAGDGVNPALSGALGNLAEFYQRDLSKQPAWYGTRYNPTTGRYDNINDRGQNYKEWVDSGGDPNQFSALSPIAGFNETQIAGQNALLNASQAQGNAAADLGRAVQTGLSGGYGYQANLQTPTTLGPAQGYQAQNYGASTVQDVQGYTPALQGDANYINQYLNPLVEQAQQQAIGNVNSSFGSGGTLGSARNAAAASRAATAASLPVLQQAANQQFAAQQAINAANQGAQNQAAQFGATAANQAGFQNQAAQNAAAQFNAAANTTAAQYGAQTGNQFAQQNANILNQADAANAAAANTASQYNLNNISNWANRIPTLQGAYQAQGNTLGQVGQQMYDLGQQQINQDVQAWNYQQNLPQQQLWNLAGLGQIAQAGQSNQLGYDATGSGFNFGDALQRGIVGGLTGGIGNLIGGLFNNGGMVPGKAGLMRRRG